MVEGKVEVDIMVLFGQINQKLDNLPGTIALKADSASLERLQDKFHILETIGTQHAQKALAGVDELKGKISSLGWQVSLALISAILSVAGTLFLGIIARGK